MGRNNQRRRAEKKRRREMSGRPAPAPGSGRITDRYLIEMLATAGSVAAFAGDAEEAARAVTALLSQAALGGPVTSVVGELVESMLGRLWAGGWQPAEVARQVRRRHRDAHVALVCSAMASAVCWKEAGGAPMPPEWSEQLDALGVACDRARSGDWLAAAIRAPGASP
ncbi:MAG: hypothetical protein ACYCUG_14620, partial [Acidimicrobiales bacterium]